MYKICFVTDIEKKEYLNTFKTFKQMYKICFLTDID